MRINKKEELLRNGWIHLLGANKFMKLGKSPIQGKALTFTEAWEYYTDSISREWIMTVYKAAEARGINNFDSALPHAWVMAVMDDTGFDVRGHFVWRYGDGIFGGPAPITGMADMQVLLHPECYC